jgi:hypothetical protein
VTHRKNTHFGTLPWRAETRTRPDRPGASQTWLFLTDTVEEVEHGTPPEEQI